MENEICPFPLRVCFMADTILLAVDSISERNQLSEKERHVLEKASHFMETVVQGKEYVDDLALGENCVEATRSYGAALKALRRLNEEGDPSPIFTKYMELLGKIQQIDEEFDIELSSKIQDVKEFFKALRAVSWERIEKSTEDVVLHGAP